MKLSRKLFVNLELDLEFFLSRKSKEMRNFRLRIILSEEKREEEMDLE